MLSFGPRPDLLSTSGALIRMEGVRAWQSGAYVTAPSGTTVSVSITESVDGSAVPNATALAMRNDSPGNYSLVLPANVSLTPLTLYLVTVTITPPGGVPFAYQRKLMADVNPGL
jgi:hypothetical protein